MLCTTCLCSQVQQVHGFVPTKPVESLSSWLKELEAEKAVNVQSHAHSAQVSTNLALWIVDLFTVSWTLRASVSSGLAYKLADRLTHLQADRLAR
jgi:hypothetical protein